MALPKNCINNQILNSLGFTLMEILVVMGILAVLGTFGYLVTIDCYKSYAFNAERDTIVAILQKARSQSLANINESAHGVHFDSGQYVIFQGAAYGGGAPFYQALPASFGITHSGIIDVVFAQLSGDANPGGNLILGDGKRSETISINNEGQINW
jgi:prepilin-type N-terminal cleavage/methylation domain-containing protein